MASYRYDRLQSAIGEIRLVYLQPGRFEDDIKARIRHVPLPLPATTPSKARDSLIESVRTSVAWPWTPEETEGGDLVMFNLVTGQMHPLQTSVPPSEEIPEYQPRYEALSYTWGDADISEYC
jgi:hypothetical protein